MAYKKPPKRSEREKEAFAYWLANPVEAVKDWFNATPDPWQADLLNGLFRDNKFERVAAKAAHGVGKSGVDAWAGWIFLNGYENSRLVATAPTFAQLHDVLFPEFSKWHAKMNDRMKEEWSISGGHIRHKGNPMDWFGVARTSNQPQNLQGFHGNHLFIIGDEASGIPQNVFEVIEGALSEAGEDGRIAKLLLNGNPNFTTGELYDAFNKNQSLYHRITVTGDPTLLPNLHLENGHHHPQHGNIYYSKRVTAKYVETMDKKYGRDSATFDVRVRGIFPRAADDAIIPFEWAERASMLPTPTNDMFDQVADQVTLVVDPARGGGAETAVGTFRRGICLKLIAKKAPSTAQSVNMVIEEIHNLVASGLKLSLIIVDEPGVGGGTIDGLRALGFPVRPYNGGARFVRGEDPDEDIRMFTNRKARDWWNLRRKLEQGNYPIPNDETLVNQLASVKYEYINEKIKVEGKEDLKDRLGKDASPDRADVLVMGCAPWFDSPMVHATIELEDMIPGNDRPAPDQAFGDFNLDPVMPF